ncbi:MAG: hypothetical protein KKA73_25575 [Chloroflexi bacterium]|nr:hypothetical protein [Chloroflexota bacterium]MBU1751068.1 hypothetical protein [Chloroflexota bacterium]
MTDTHTFVIDTIAVELGVAVRQVATTPGVAANCRLRLCAAWGIMSWSCPRGHVAGNGEKNA